MAVDSPNIEHVLYRVECVVREQPKVCRDPRTIQVLAAMALDAMGEPCEDLAAAKQFLTYIYILEGFRSAGDAFFDALKATESTPTHPDVIKLMNFFTNSRDREFLLWEIKKRTDCACLR